MITVRLARFDGPNIAFRISKQAVKRWVAVPEDEKEWVCKSAQQALRAVVKDDPFLFRWKKLMLERAGRKDRMRDMRKGPLSFTEAKLVTLWRMGRKIDRVAIRRMCDRQDRNPALRRELNDVLRFHWYVADGFGLCWLSFEALAIALKEWGFGKIEAATLARQCQRAGLVSFKHPVADKNQIERVARVITIH